MSIPKVLPLMLCPLRQPQLRVCPPIRLSSAITTSEPQSHRQSHARRLLWLLRIIGSVAARTISFPYRLPTRLPRGRGGIALLKRAHPQLCVPSGWGRRKPRYASPFILSLAQTLVCYKMLRSRGQPKSSPKNSRPCRLWDDHGHLCRGHWRLEGISAHLLEWILQECWKWRKKWPCRKMFVSLRPDINP